MKSFSGVLEPPVIVKQRMGIRAGLYSLIKGFVDKRIVIAFAKRIRHDTPVVQVENGAEVEIKLAYLIQRIGIKNLENSRNKGFRHIGRDRKPFSFCGKLYSCEKRCLEVNPPHRHLNPLEAKSKGSEISCVYSLFIKNPFRELDFVRFSVYNWLYEMEE